MRDPALDSPAPHRRRAHSVKPLGGA